MHRLPSQTRRNSAPTPPLTGLKRSGAIRRPTNPPFSAQEINERPVTRYRSNTIPTSRQGMWKTVPIEARTPTPEQTTSSQKDVRRLEPSALARKTNIYVQTMDNLHSENLTDVSGSSSSSSRSSPSPSSDNSDTDFDSDNSQRWQDALE